MFHLKNIFLCDCSQTGRKSPPLRKKHICRPLHPHQNPRLQKSFSLPYFSPPPKKNKFPSPTPAYFQHTEQKSTAYNIVLLKCGVKVKIQYSVFLCHNCFFVPHFFINLVPRKKQLLHLVEFELKFFFRPHFSNTFSVGRHFITTVLKINRQTKNNQSKKIVNLKYGKEANLYYRTR